MSPLVLNPMFAIDARGSITGITFSNGPGGSQAKKKAKPARRRRTSQPRNRSILIILSRQWGSLTSQQRTDWITYAGNNPVPNKFGNDIILSGSNYFVKLNHTAVRLADGTAVVVTPPVTDPPAAVDTLTVATGATTPGDVDLTWTEFGVGIAADFYEIQVAGPFQSAGRESVDSKYKFNQTVAGNVLLVTVAGLVELMQYWFRVRYVGKDGQITNWHIGQATPKVTP